MYYRTTSTDLHSLAYLIGNLDIIYLAIFQECFCASREIVPETLTKSKCWAN